MLNQKHNVHKRTNSKILLIILCIFGLLFSYSCSCKNRVTGPGNDGLENGKPGGQTDNKGGSGDDSGQTIIKDGDLTADSTKVIRVSGDTVKIAAMIKFKNATATLKSFADTDSTTLTDGDITYDTATSTLTLKADTTDTSKIDTTVGGKITWEKASKKITATFTLTPAQNVTLSETEKTVVIEIYKEKLLDPKTHIGALFTQASGFSPTEFGFTVQLNNPTDTDITGALKALDSGKNKGEVKYDKNTFIDSLKNNIEQEANKQGAVTKITYKSMNLVNDASAGNGKWSFTFNFTFSGEDYDLTDEQKNGVDYRLDLTVGDATNPVEGSWVVFE